MPDLSIEVRDRDIVISKPSAGLTMNYRRVGHAPCLKLWILFATNSIQRSLFSSSAHGRPHSRERRRWGG